MHLPSLNDRLAMRKHPGRSPVMFQRWSELLFLHWEIDPEIIQARIPDGLRVDLFEGKTYLGLVPFFMKKVRPRFLPCVPWLSNFMELNVRAYVHDEQGRPGVWFFSLDCNQPIAVELARKFFHLPYEHARMSSRPPLYKCTRRGQTQPAQYRYSPTESESLAIPGTLEFFLLERYLLFSQTPSGDIKCGRVHHTPYPFSVAENPPSDASPLHWNGFDLGGAPVSALISSGVDVEIFGLQTVLSGTEKER